MEKGLERFYKNKARYDGIDNYCIECKKKSEKESDYGNSENRKNYTKAWRENNRDKCNSYSKKQREKYLSEEKILIEKQICFECGSELPIGYFTKDKYSRTGYTYNCNSCRSVRSSDYKKSDRGREKTKQYEKDRYENNVEFKIHKNVSRAIQKSLVGVQKNSSIWEHLLYTPQQLKEHLESLWEPWMNWENYGKLSLNKRTWQIDHVMPKSSFNFSSTKDEEFQKCWSLENLKPLEAMENVKKGNKILFKEEVDLDKEE